MEDIHSSDDKETMFRFVKFVAKTMDQHETDEIEFTAQFDKVRLEIVVKATAV